MTSTIKKTREKKFLVDFFQNDRLKNELVNYYIFFDTETDQQKDHVDIGHKDYDIIKNTLKLGHACFWNRKTNEFDWLEFQTIKDFHLWLSGICTKTKNATIWIIAHNIVFDSLIVDMWRFMEDHKYNSEFIHNKGMIFIQKLKNKNGKNIVIVNNGNIFAEKLEVIGETIGLPKMEIDFLRSDIEYLSTYCKRDVEILIKFWQQWISFIEENKLGRLKYTISSQSLEAYRKRFCKNYIVIDDNMENIKFERNAYYGGRTEIFYKGTVTDPVYYYDLNSAYAYVMKMFRFPTEFKFMRVNPSVAFIKGLIDKNWLVIAECYINTNENVYPYREGELLFPTGKFKTYLSTPEVLYALEHGHIEKFGQVSFYFGDKIFEDYINFFYDNRMKLKAEENKQEKIHKLFLTNLYGKLAQKNSKWEKITVQDLRKYYYRDFDLDKWLIGEYKTEKIIVAGVDISPKLRYIGNELQMSIDESESDISFPAITSHVTAHVRIILWNDMKACKEQDIKVYYCDTDALFTNKPLPDYLVSQTELGKLKLEKEFKYGLKLMGLKNYAELDQTGNVKVKDSDDQFIRIDDQSFLNESKIIKGDTWKLKGISNNARLLDKNIFIQQEWSGISKQQYYKNFGRQDGEFWIIYVTKKIEGDIKKGEKLNNGEIIPFNLV